MSGRDEGVAWGGDLAAGTWQPRQEAPPAAWAAAALPVCQSLGNVATRAAETSVAFLVLESRAFRSF